MFESFFSSLVAGTHAPLFQGSVIVLGTLILEDPTTVLTGLLIVKGVISYQTGFIALACGIVIGDTLLYLAGFGLRQSSFLAKRVHADKLTRAKDLLHRNIFWALLLSRIVPGMRVPMYAAAGVLKIKWPVFVGIIVGLSLVWTALLLYLTRRFGEFAFQMMGPWAWAMIILVIFIMFTSEFMMARRKLETK